MLDHEADATGERGEDTAAVRFTDDIVADVSRQVPYREETLRAAVSQHVQWGDLAFGLPFEREFLFRRDVIGVAVQQLPMRSDASLGRRRAVLLRVAEALGVTERALPPLYGSEPSAPYSEAEVAEMRIWAAVQRDERRIDARVLLALGIGCGLTASEICEVSGDDVREAGSRIAVPGRRERLVDVDGPWRDALAHVELIRRNTRLFRPGVQNYANKISDFTRATIGEQPRPRPQRMRATWLVARMAEGVPVQELLYAAGVKSLDALARFERYLPPPAAASLPGTPERR